jgi:hypothetical protein
MGEAVWPKVTTGLACELVACILHALPHVLVRSQWRTRGFHVNFSGTCNQK